jgi:hypothetical protein
VYHDKVITAFFSTIIREMVTRFQSLLKPNYMLMIRKSNEDLQRFIQHNHPFSRMGQAVENTLHYVENDFSKYDKSQDKLVFELEAYVFKELGFSHDLVEKWLDGHIECKVRIPGNGISFDVDYQRKSGDATTAFGNSLLNILSVTYAYEGLEPVWAVFVGDDSLICSTQTVHNESVRILQEVFNLQAKMYVTNAPYFASNFIIIDYLTESVRLLPDPIKRIEKLSQPIAAENPNWSERYQSYIDVMGPYRSTTFTSKLPSKLVERYERLDITTASTVSDALATLTESEMKFRSVWENMPTCVGR